MNIVHLILLMVINMMEYLMFYLLGSKLVNERVAISFKKSDIKMVAIGLIYTIVVGSIAYASFINYIDNYILRIIAMIYLMLLIKYFSKESLTNVFLIFIITFLIIIFIQTPLNMLLTILKLEGFYISLTGQILALVSTLVLCFKVPIHYFYGLVQKQILLKLILYIAMCVSFILLLYANYHYTVGSLIYFLALFTLTMIGLTLVLVRVSFYTNQVSKNLHDTKNLLGGIHITAHSTTDINEIRKNLDECIELLQLQNSLLDNFEANQEKENILLFIKQKKERLREPLEIVTQITYIDAHERIPLGMIIYMLGTLLDNAIDYTVQHQIKQKPILIELLVMDDSVEIHVSNPYENVATVEFNKAFEKGHSTKLSHKRGRDGRGYGLFNLKRTVRKYGGIIYYGNEYRAEYNYKYLTISIDIGCYSSWKAQQLEKSTSYNDKTLFLVNMK